MQATSVSIGTLSERLHDLTAWFWAVSDVGSSKVPETWWFQPQIGALRCLRTKLWPWRDIRQLCMVAWRLAPRGRCYAENHPGLRFTRNYFQYTYVCVYIYNILFDGFDVNIVLHGSFFFKSKHCYKKAHMPLQSGFLWALVGYVGAPPGSMQS